MYICTYILYDSFVVYKLNVIRFQKNFRLILKNYLSLKQNHKVYTSSIK